MTQDVAKTIEGLVGLISNQITGTFDALTGRTNTCTTKWLRVGKKVIDENGDEFVITEIEPGQWVVAVNPDPTKKLDGLFYIANPYFVPGTKISANREWTIESNFLMEKTPLVWLLDQIQYRKFGRESSVDFETDVRIFFLDETDILNYYTRDHRENVVDPMTELANEFLKVVSANQSFKRIEQYDILTFTRFGVESETGSLKNILDANLSGVELRLTLVKYKENCKFC